jgi:hypothetical protein
MQLLNVLTIAGVLSAGLSMPRPQDPPPPPVQTSAPQGQTAPPAQPPSTPPAVPAVPAAAGVTSPTPPLNTGEVRRRLESIYIFEGVLINAVKLAAQNTAGEIRRIEPGLVMFSSAPVRAHGTYLEGYGVFFQVEIPSVIPSMVSLVERLQRDERARPTTSPAQPTALTGGSAEALMDPDAHYVQSVKDQLINAMIKLSNSMELRPEEWLTVAARDGSESPGQVTQPSTMTLRIKGADLADFFANRIQMEEVRKRVQVRGF